MLIYHLAPAERWHTWPDNQPYLPEAYAAEGFIHCTAGDELMIRVANHFYRDTPGDFLLLVLDPSLLTSELRWEQSGDNLASVFPHIYGPIDRAAVTEVRPIQRAADGTFVGW